MILVQLDSVGLLSVELVSRGWQWSVAKYQLWRRLLAHCVSTDPVWHGLVERRGWLEFINQTDPVYLSVLLERRRMFVAAKHEVSEFSLFNDLPFDYELGKFGCSKSMDNPNNQSFHSSHSLLNKSACQCTVRSINKSDNKSYVFNQTYDGHTTSNNFFSNQVIHSKTTSVNYLEQQDPISQEAIMFAHRFYKMLYPRIIRDIAVSQ